MYRRMFAMIDEIKDSKKKEASVLAETERTRNKKLYLPRVDIYGTKDSIVLIADMPGVDEKSVDVIIDKHVLKLTGTVRTTKYEGHSIAYAEYDDGDYERKFTISEEVDQDRIDAIIKDGVLHLTLHKVDHFQTRKIAINAA
jgi:HSP20 family protein